MERARYRLWQVNMTINIKLISSILGILAMLAAGGLWIYNYHTTLATKENVNLIYIELRLQDSEDSLLNYTGRALSDAEKTRKQRLLTTISRLEAERDKIMGLAQ